MTHLRLIENFRNIFNTRQIDDLYDLLSDDFYFKNPRIEIFGKENYIKYVKENCDIYTTETVKIHKNTENKYVREYYLTFLNSSLKYSDRLHIFETLEIKDGLICCSIIEYETDHISDITEDILAKASKNYGQFLER